MITLQKWEKIQFSHTPAQHLVLFSFKQVDIGLPGLPPVLLCPIFWSNFNILTSH